MILSCRYRWVMAMVLMIWSCSDSSIEPEGDLITYTVGQEFEFYGLLSDYGFYSGILYNLEPVSSVFGYDLSTPLFSDYTIKDRFIWIPPNTSIGYAVDGVVDFPPGTCIIKNFSSLDNSDQPLRLETRLLLLDPHDEQWKVMVYLWNSEQTDAVKHIIGQNIDIRVKNTIGTVINTQYKVPNTNDCKRCHNLSNVTTPIGPKIRSLNTTMNGQSMNQLEIWSSDGRLTGWPAIGAPVLPEWMNDNDFTLDQRARAYLEMNCAHCHNEAGDAASTSLFLEFDQADSSHLGFYKTPIAAGIGTGGHTYDIVPGNADESIVLYRMNSNAGGVAMPEIARSVIHTEGVELIREWINSF